MATCCRKYDGRQSHANFFAVLCGRIPLVVQKTSGSYLHFESRLKVKFPTVKPLLRQGSVKPWVHFVCNLPPWLRYRAENMLVQAIIPAKLKDQAARKYYNFAASFEMNRLYHEGVNGVRVVRYGTSLDSPGRRELLAMQLVSAYYCCPTCLHTWQPGPFKKLVCGGYRRFLNPRHPMRAKAFYFRTIPQNRPASYPMLCNKL